MNSLQEVINFFTLPKTGLILNFVGTIMVAVSFGKNLGGAYQKDDKGNEIYLASFRRPKLFYFGLFLLGLGFLLQLIGFKQ
jgi:hypothetical protein